MKFIKPQKGIQLKTEVPYLIKPHRAKHEINKTIRGFKVT
jgi:hypothetical protein